jgi:DNA gyrase inhibitor GyrI
MTIETFPNYRLAYIRRVGRYGPENKDTMESLKAWARAKNLLTETAVIFGIPQDNPEYTAPEQCRYDACIIIPDSFVIDDTVEEGEFPGGTYGVFKITHTQEEVQKAYREIVPCFLEKGLEIANKPVIEKYAMEMIELNYCEICVPIA